MCSGRRKVHHFCKTTTSQIMWAAIAAPGAPLSTPLSYALVFINFQLNHKYIVINETITEKIEGFSAKL